MTGRIMCWHRLCFVATGILALAACVPAGAYNGNILRMMWDAQRAMVDGNTRRAADLVGLALTHLEDEGFRRSEKFVARLDERLPEASDEERAWVEAEKAFIELRLDWLSHMRDEIEWWDEQLSEPVMGVLGPSRHDIRRRLEFETVALDTEMEAVVAEYDEGDFDRAHELRVQALELWRKQLEDIESSISRMRRNAGDAEGDEEAAEHAAREAYLARWLEGATRHADALAKEVEFETDPVALSGRLHYHEARAEFYRPAKCEAFGTVAGLYREKIDWARSRGGEGDGDGDEMVPPQWFCATVLERAWYGFKRHVE